MSFRHAAVIALFVPTWAWANFLNGNTLKTLCNMQDETVCRAYVLGVIDSAMTLQASGFSTVSICTPGEVSGEQATAIVEKYLTEHPEELHTAASSLVLQAIGIAFPCTE